MNLSVSFSPVSLGSLAYTSADDPLVVSGSSDRNIMLGELGK